MEEIIEFKVNRIKAAFAIAIVADLLEFPITWLEHFEWEIVRLLAQGANVLIDCAVMWAMTKLLGYHWLFLADLFAFFVEVIPQVDMFPTWIACVAYVVHERKKAQQGQPQSPQPRPIIDIDQIKAVGASLAARLTCAAIEYAGRARCTSRGHVTSR